MNQSIAMMIYHEVLLLTQQSSERFGLSFEGYPVEYLMSSDRSIRMEATASIDRNKEASAFLLKTRNEISGYNTYNKGRYIHSMLSGSKMLALDAPEYTALTIYIALHDFCKIQGIEHFYKATITDDKFYYHEFCIIGALSPGVLSGVKVNLGSIAQNLSGIFKTFEEKADLPWVIDSTFNIVTRIDLYLMVLYDYMINKKLAGNEFKKVTPFIVTKSMSRLFRNKTEEFEDKFIWGEELSPMEYFHLVMTSDITMHKIIRTNDESMFSGRKWRI